MSDDRFLPLLRRAGIIFMATWLLLWLGAAAIFVRNIYADLDVALTYAFFKSEIWTAAAVRAAAAEAGLPAAAPAWFWLLAIESTLLVTFAGLGFLLVLRLRNRLGVVLGVSFVLVGTSISGPVMGMYETVLPGANLLTLIEGLGFFPFAALFYYFPNGRFVPRWGMWLTLLMAPIVVLSFSSDNAVIESAILLWLTLGGLGQIYRYLRVSTAQEKAQSRWPMLALVAFVALLVGSQFLPANAVDQSAPPSGADLLGWAGFFLLLVIVTILFVVAVAIAILRYRLYSIDLIIRRTAIYGLLTALLALVYYGSVLLIQQVLALFNAGQSPLSIVISTLLSAALFNPLRSRVQRFIDRRFFRASYDARLTLERFASAARDEVDLAQLTAALENVVGRTMQPTQLNLWLRSDMSDDNSAS